METIPASLFPHFPNCYLRTTGFMFRLNVKNGAIGGIHCFSDAWLGLAVTAVGGFDVAEPRALMICLFFFIGAHTLAILWWVVFNLFTAIHSR